MNRAMLLLGCYRKQDCADPEVFAAAVVAILSHYPVDVVAKVTDPHRGLPSTLKWFPTPYEIREACDVLNEAAKRRAEADARVKQQLAERERVAAMDAPERRKAFMAKWRKDMMFALADKEVGAKFEDFDVRDCEPGLEERIAEANLAKAEYLKSKSISEPMRLSDAALRAIGLSSARPALHPSSGASFPWEAEAPLPDTAPEGF